MRELHCATCQADALFEEFPCGADLDGANLDEDIELVCTGCGTAVVAAPLTVRMWLRPRTSAVAPQQRRAA